MPAKMDIGGLPPMEVSQPDVIRTSSRPQILMESGEVIESLFKSTLTLEAE
jgi:hypothetical protein